MAVNTVPVVLVRYMLAPEKLITLAVDELALNIPTFKLYPWRLSVPAVNVYVPVTTNSPV